MDKFPQEIDDTVSELRTITINTNKCEVALVALTVN